VEVDDPKHHHQGDTTKEPNDPELPTKHMTTNTMKRRWGRHALLIGFASRQYPKVSNYLMTNKITTDLESHSHGFQITYKQLNY
jgi:hypothetical protein